MPGRVVPWEISWRAVLGLGSSSFVSSGASWVVVVVVGLVFAFRVAFGVASVAVGSRIAEGAMVGVGGFFFDSCWCVFSFLDADKRRFVFFLPGTIFMLEVRELVLIYLHVPIGRPTMVIGGRRPISIVESSRDPISFHGQHFSANYLYYLGLIEGGMKEGKKRSKMLAARSINLSFQNHTC
jgi:hypothetical protein